MREHCWSVMLLVSANMVGTPQVALAQNMVTNPNFDTDVASWFIDPGLPDTYLLWGANGYTPASGSGVVFTPANPNGIVRLQQVVTITQSGPQYRFQAVVSVDSPVQGTGWATLEVREFPPGGNCNGPLIYSTSQVPVGTPWKHFRKILGSLPNQVCIVLDARAVNPSGPGCVIARLDSVYLAPMATAFHDEEPEDPVNDGGSAVEQEAK